jgi:predicted nuclease of predicted toxin-antitoxin system
MTFDLHFGELLAFGVRLEPRVVIFRLADESAAAVNARLEAVLRYETAALERGALILVEDSRYRVRPLPIQPG